MKKISDLIPIKVSKVSTNDDWPLIYLPKEAIKRLDLKKGDKVILYLNLDGSRLIIEKVTPRTVQRALVDGANGNGAT